MNFSTPRGDQLPNFQNWWIFESSPKKRSDAPAAYLHYGRLRALHSFGRSSIWLSSFAPRGFERERSGTLRGANGSERQLLGAKPNYTDMQQVSFDDVGEKAIGRSAAYGFAAFG